MKKTFAFAALSLAVLTATAQAQESDANSPYKGWVGVYGLKYNTDDDRPLSQGIYNDGDGWGAEFGVRINEQWGARFDFSQLSINYDQPVNGENEDTGPMYGIDAMYFLPEDVAYLFAGFRQQALADSQGLVNAGVGKHWRVTDRFRVSTEFAGLYDAGDDFKDFMFKIGLNYTFGSVPSSSGSSDSDGDGVIDSRDQCPGTPAGVTVDENGCNNDLDGDGVVNANDQCPDTPYGTEVDAKGCALQNKQVAGDADGDGVPDDRDQCADTPRRDKVDSDGCTIFDVEEVSTTLRVLFDNNSANVKHPNDPEIAEFAGFMKRYGKTTALIEGHTSAPGTEEYNMDLSERRARAFKAVLIDQYDIDPSRLETKGYGETELLDESGTAEAARVNRRISITVKAEVKVPEER